MPIVPFAPQPAAAPPAARLAPPDPKFLLMAAAQMNSEDRLIKPEPAGGLGSQPGKFPAASQRDWGRGLEEWETPKREFSEGERGVPRTGDAPEIEALKRRVLEGKFQQHMDELDAESTMNAIKRGDIPTPSRGPKI